MAKCPYCKIDVDFKNIEVVKRGLGIIKGIVRIPKIDSIFKYLSVSFHFLKRYSTPKNEKKIITIWSIFPINDFRASIAVKLVLATSSAISEVSKVTRRSRESLKEIDNW